MLGLATALCLVLSYGLSTSRAQDQVSSAACNGDFDFFLLLDTWVGSRRNQFYVHNKATAVFITTSPPQCKFQTLANCSNQWLVTLWHMLRVSLVECRMYALSSVLFWSSFAIEDYFNMNCTLSPWHLIPPSSWLPPPPPPLPGQAVWETTLPQKWLLLYKSL